MGKRQVFKNGIFGRMLGMTLVFVMMAAGCNTGDNSHSVTYTGEDGSGTPYRLTITKNSARAYAPQSGDYYVLIIGSNKSEGTVSTFIGGTFTLRPAVAAVTATFTVTVSSSGITAVVGTITLVSGGTMEGPGPVTPTGGNGDGEPLTGYLGDGDLTLSGTIEKAVFTGDDVIFTPYTENDTLNVTIGDVTQTSPVTGGKFSVTIKKPTASFSSLSALLAGYDSTPEVSPETQGALLDLELASNDTSVNKMNAQNTLNGFRAEEIKYFYAVNDAVASFTENTDASLPDTILQFKKGWNAVYIRFENQGESGVKTLSINEAALRWTFEIEGED
jgi:hypothetical protein